MMCYRIGFACDSEPEAVALASMDKYLSQIMVELAIEMEVDEEDTFSPTVFLSGFTNFRNDYAVTAPYKGNREGSRKPVHMPALRQHLLDEWDAYLTEDEEADDAIAIKATEYGDDSVIVSLDKDFDQVQGWHYNFHKQHLYYVTHDEGELNFYKQFLVGDRVDNIIGVKGIGDKKSHKLLSELGCSVKMFQACVELLGYERAVENGRLLYLRRKEGELWEPPKSQDVE